MIAVASSETYRHVRLDASRILSMYNFAPSPYMQQSSRGGTLFIGLRP